MGFLEKFNRKRSLPPKDDDGGFSLPVSMETFGIAAGPGQDATSWAAVDMIAAAIANLSGSFYERDSRTEVSNHPVYNLLRNPNPDESRFEFLYSSVVDYFEHGNVFWYIYDTDGEPTSLFRLQPSTVGVGRDLDNRKVFNYNGKEYRSDKIIHIPSRFGYDGLRGRSIFSACHNIFRLSRELDEYLNNTFNNSVGSRLVLDLKMEKDTPKEDIERFQRQFAADYTGLKNAGKPLFKNPRVNFETLDTKLPTNQASQLQENRAFQEKEIAKLFGIPLALLSGENKSNNIESLFILFVQNAVLPVATQFEQAISKLALYRQIYFEFSYNSLMKTNIGERFACYDKQLSMGLLSINEARRKENLPPIEGGDIHWMRNHHMPVKEEIADSYMAGAKLKQLQYEQQLNSYSPGVAGNHSALGDDRE